MHPVKFKISKIGRVRDSELTVSDFVIFSGESGLGKSYMALLCHYVFRFLLSKSTLNLFFESQGIDYKKLRRNFKNSGIALSVKKNDIEKWLSLDAVAYLSNMLNYQINGEVSIVLPEIVPEELVFYYKEELTGLVNAEDVDVVLSMKHLNYRVQELSTFDESPFSFLLRHELCSYIFGDYKKLQNSYVFPPSRGSVLSENVNPITGLFLEYQRSLLDIYRPKVRPEDGDDYTEDLLHSIQKGEVRRVDGKLVFYSGDINIPITAAAASVRELAPLELLVRKNELEGVSILFEEPESHLHPEKQRLVADLVTYIIQKGAFLQVTTHSDYFLRRLNEIINVNRLKSSNSIAYEEIVNKGLVCPSLDLSKIKAYLLVDNGDGTSRIVEQDIKKGIPFSSFFKAISDNLNNQSIIELSENND